MNSHSLPSSSLSGTKKFTILPPNHPSLSEGHIREAKFAHQFTETTSKEQEEQHSHITNNQTTSVTLYREELLESTSRVHSPSLCENEDLLDFIRKEEATVCEVHEGDVLFLPSYFWHEVESTVLTKGSNIAYDHHVAMNLWMWPLFDKETFPCHDCGKRFNKK